MVRRLAIAAAFAATASPALATGGVYCDGVSNKSVSIALTVGRVPGFAVVGAVITAKDTIWVMNHTASGTPMVVAQAAADGPWIIADFADKGSEAIVASLRLAHLRQGDDSAAAGVLSIPKLGVWAVRCEVD